jgi:hypothetical protein
MTPSFSTSLILPPDLEQFNEFASDILIEEEHLL